MIQVYPNLWVGSDADVDEFKDDYPEGLIIHAAKYPWHKAALGYTGRGAPKDHPEYLVASVPEGYAYNMVDSPKPEFIAKGFFVHASAVWEAAVDEEVPVLIHCNQGCSRSVGLAMYCLAKHTSYFAEDGLTVPFEAACDMFEEDYPDAAMADGVRGKLEELWEDL